MSDELMMMDDMPTKNDYLWDTLDVGMIALI